MEKGKEMKKKFSDRLAERYDDYPKALQKGKYPFIILGILIPVIHFFVFYMGTNLTSILLAFQETKYVQGVGEVTTWTLDNFVEVFEYITQGGSDLFVALRNTLELFVVDLLMMIPIFIFAYCFAQNMKGAKFFRVAMYLPTIISAVAFSTMVTSILQADVGALAVLVKDIFHINLPPLLTSNENAWPTIIAYCMWAGVYANLLIIEGAIRRVPAEVIEAAKIDGAGPLKILVKVILPMTWGTLSTLLIIKVSGLFTITGPILLLTNGAYDTQTLNFWFYKMVAVDSSYNVPAAGGIVFTLIGLPIVFGFKWIVDKFSDNLEY